MKKVVRRGNGASILGDMQNTIGGDSEHPAPAALVLSWDFGLDRLQSSLLICWGLAQQPAKHHTAVSSLLPPPRGMGKRIKKNLIKLAA